MTPRFARAVDPVFSCMLDLLERIDNTQDLEPHKEKARLMERFDTAGSQTAVVPVVVGADATALAMVQRLHEEGVFVNCVISPATAPGRALIRTSLMATHTREQLTQALEAIHKVARELSVLRPVEV